MKNPFFIGLIWLILFLLEVLFPWQVGGYSFKPWGSFFILGYAFFALPWRQSLTLAVLAFLVQSAFTSQPVDRLQPVVAFTLCLSLYLGIFWIRRKTFSGNLAGRAIAVALILSFDFYLLELLKRDLVYFPSLIFWFGFLVQFGVHLIAGIFLFWLLEEPGADWEERLFAFRAKKGQLHLFEARHLRPARRRSSFKIQRRLRRRFGLRSSW